MDKKCTTFGSDAPKKIANTLKGLAPLRGVQQERLANVHLYTGGDRRCIRCNPNGEMHLRCKSVVVWGSWLPHISPPPHHLGATPVSFSFANLYTFTPYDIWEFRQSPSFVFVHLCSSNSVCKVAFGKRHWRSIQFNSKGVSCIVHCVSGALWAKRYGVSQALGVRRSWWDAHGGMH